MASDMPPVYAYIKSLLSKPPPDKNLKFDFSYFERKTKRACVYAYNDVTAFPDSSYIAVLHTDTELIVYVEFGKEGFKALRQNDEGNNYGLMIVFLDGNTVKGISNNIRDDFEFTIPEESGKPSCIAVQDSNSIAISFPAKNKILFYNKEGQEQKQSVDLVLIDGLFLISKNCYIYATLEGIELISDTSKTYKFKTSSTPRDICCDNDGNIYVVVETDEASCKVDCFTRNGAHMGCVVENCGIPHDITLTPSRNLIVAADKSVKIYGVPLPWGMFKCSDRECIACTKHVKESSSFTHYETKEHYQIKSHISCTSTNIIYVITCKKCGFQCFDYTDKPLEKQIVAHGKSVANAIKKHTKFVQHYKKEGHTKDDMVIQGIESLVDSVGLGRTERSWIDELQTKTHGLNDRLPRSKKPSARNNIKEAGMFKCTEDKCIFCEKHAKESTSFTCSFGARAGKNYNILSRITCTTDNVIYLITCKICKIQYVGQTKQHLKARMSVHRSKVNTDIITQHFIGEHSIEDMVVQGIESLGKKTKRTLIKERKEFWNNELQMREMNGLLSLVISEG